MNKSIKARVNMKTKLTLTIDAPLMQEINKKAKLNKNINLSKMVEQFLFKEFNPASATKKSSIKSLRGILRETDDLKNWKQNKLDRLSKKHQ